MHHPPCDDCPIGNRAPDHEDHDPTRGPCPNADDCDKHEAKAVEDAGGLGALFVVHFACGAVGLAHQVRRNNSEEEQR